MIIMFARWTSGTTTMLINPFGVRRMSARVLICARSWSFHASRFRGRGSNNHGCSIGSWIFRTLKSKKKIRKKKHNKFQISVKFFIVPIFYPFYLATIVEGAHIPGIHFSIICTSIRGIIIRLTIGIGQQFGFTQAGILVGICGTPTTVYPQTILAINIQGGYLIGTDYC